MELDINYEKDTPEFIQKELDKFKAFEYKEYLDSTDWYYARKLETGEEVPSAVLSKRVKARNFLKAY
jgi:hypothetical protein